MDTFFYDYDGHDALTETNKDAEDTFLLVDKFESYKKYYQFISKLGGSDAEHSSNNAKAEAKANNTIGLHNKNLSMAANLLASRPTCKGGN